MLLQFYNFKSTKTSLRYLYLQTIVPVIPLEESSNIPNTLLLFESMSTYSILLLSQIVSAARYVL
ncbi:hypothetical protein HMPREF9714_01331 [Myroides odoratimimus CCUG 12901]|nr:hypothetical protein HMPREF9714_01331 [Myroides odoratimimus CCUG 12901]